MATIVGGRWVFSIKDPKPITNAPEGAKVRVRMRPRRLLQGKTGE